MQSGFFVPSRKFWGPLLQMRPHQIAEFTNFLLGIELGAEVHEMQESPEAEAHNEMLAVIKGKNAAGMFFREAGAK